MEQIAELEGKVQELLSLLDASKQLNSNLAIEEVFQNILLQMVEVLSPGKKIGIEGSVELMRLKTAAPAIKTIG